MSNPEQAELLHSPESRQIIQRVADDVSTLRATKDRRASQTAPPTIVSHDDSTIDEKVFEWDNEIVNAETYRRAMTHAREKYDTAARPAQKEEKLDAISQDGTEESSDRLSPMESPSIADHQKPPPYEMSVVSEPSYMEQDRVSLPNSSVSDRPASRRSILSYRLKSSDGDKRSLWSTISGKRSHRTLAPPERNAAPGSIVSSISTAGVRRGKRGFESSFHTSIDFGSEEGLSAPPIVRAAQAGSIVEVERLLDQRADINARHAQSGRNALLVASHCGNVEVVRLLLRYGALMNERDASLLSALHLAALRGHVDIVEALLQEHAEIDIKGPDDRTPLRIAAEKEQIEVAEVLLRKQAKVNVRDKSQMSPLHVSARHGDAPMTELLVKNGAHIEAKDSNFMGAMHYACENGHSSVVSILLNQKGDIEARGKASMTPLMCAAAAGKVQVLELLYKKKASLKQKGEGDMTALHWASFNGHVEVVDFLVQKRAPVAVSNKDGRTPLHLAVMAEEFAVADLLLRKGASPEAQCKSGLKPLHYSCTSASVEITQLLLGYNANVEVEDSARNRPLHKACTRGSLSHVELLVKKGVSIDARNARGDRPLCLASSMGHVDVVRLLLNRGAATRSKFASGPSHEDSPLCLAAKGGHVAVVQELLMRGASVLQKDERDWQPLRYAAFYGHPDVVDLLLEHGATVSGSASGGWGFNMTAQRIGFTNDVPIEEQKKGEILRLLTNAEAKEQKTQEYTASVERPNIPPAVQNQTMPMELPGPTTVNSPIQATRTSAPPFQPPPVSEMNAESRQPPNPGTAYPPQLNANPAAPVSQPYASPQQPQQVYMPQYPTDPRYFATGNIPSFSAQASPVPMPSNQSYFLNGYPNHLQSPAPVPIPAASSTQPQPPTTYTFVPKPINPMHPSQPQPYSPMGQHQMMPDAYAPAAGASAAPTMTLGPDGLWRQMPPQSPGVQRMPSQSGVTQPQSATSMNYPTGIYEMAS